MAPLGHLHLAILLALSTGPTALVALGRRLPNTRDFGRELSDLLAKGWICGRSGIPYLVELTDSGRLILELHVMGKATRT